MNVRRLVCNFSRIQIRDSTYLLRKFQTFIFLQNIFFKEEFNEEYKIIILLSSLFEYFQFSRLIYEIINKSLTIQEEFNNRFDNGCCSKIK